MIFQMGPVQPIDTADVRRTAFARLKENGNYKRTALMIGLMLALVNVPVLIMSCATTWNVDLDALDTGALMIVNTRLILFQVLIGLFISPALELGKARYMMHTMRESAGNPTELFDGLNGGTYFVSIRAMLWRTLMLYIWMMIPASVAVQGLMAYSAGMGIGTLILGGALTLAVYVTRYISYSQQYFMLSDNPRMGAMASLKLSTIVMHGRMGEYFRLALTLLPYILPPLAPTVAALFLFTDSDLFAVAMSVMSIALGAVCYPRAEAAAAEYYLRIKSIMMKKPDVNGSDYIEIGNPSDNNTGE